nr:MAG TPA: hypothetical protein [Caudoviricetes sp.]
MFCTIFYSALHWLILIFEVLIKKGNLRFILGFLFFSHLSFVKSYLLLIL